MICNRDAVEHFLADRLAGQELCAFEDHLEECPACRDCLDNLAADRTWWDEVRTYLSAGGQRVDGPKDETDCTLFGMKNYLTPTDDPRMLGRLGPYEISGIIGCGGMGVVLKAFDAPLNRYVAIKVLGPHLATNPESRQRFAREAKAAAAVVNLNVIAIHAVAEANGLPYFVMPYVSGPSLEKRLRGGGVLSTVEILRIGMQIASGLAAAHAQGVVHRDIKPANIMLDEGTERVTITDFGLARAGDDASMTQTGVVAGTPQYMSPEQARGETVDHRSDLFSLGSVLYACATGQPPFQATTSLGVLKRVEDCRPRPVREWNPTVPLLLADIIERLHAKNPVDRFQTAANVAELLERYLAHLAQPESAAAPALPASPERRSSVASSLVMPCTSCGTSLKVQAGLAGKQVKCPKCDTTLAVPAQPPRKGTMDTKNAKPGRTPRITFGTSALFALIALAVGTGLWFAVRDRGSAKNQSFAERPEPLPTVFEQDFRKTTRLPLPEGMHYYYDSTAKDVQCRADGLRIKNTRPSNPKQGLAVATDFGLKGDFDVSVSFDSFAGEKPLHENGYGFNLVAQTFDGEKYTFARRVDKQRDGFGWHNGPIPAGNFSAPGAAAGTMRLVRTGSTLYRLWTPNLDGTDFQVLDKSHIGTDDLRHVYLNLFTGQMPLDIEVRVLAWRISGQKESNPGPGAPVVATANRGWARTLFLVAVIVVMLALSTWIFISWRRSHANPAAAAGQTGQVNRRMSHGLKTASSSALLLLIILGLGMAAWYAFNRRPAEPLKVIEPLPTVYYQDFRNLPNEKLPADLVFRNVEVTAHAQLLPEGLQLKAQKPYLIKRNKAFGVQTTFGLKGDFDITVAFDQFKADTPKPAAETGVGFTLRAVTTIKGMTGICRWVQADRDGVTWGDSDFAPTKMSAGRLRLARIGTIIYRMWSPEIKGDDFQLLAQMDRGVADDVKFVYFEIGSREQVVDVETRVLELLIRGQKEINPR